MTNFIEWIGDIWDDHKRGISALLVMVLAVWLSAFAIHFFMSEWWVVPLVFNLAIVGLLGVVVSLIHVMDTCG